MARVCGREVHGGHRLEHGSRDRPAPQATAAEVEEAIQSARKAFLAWSEFTIAKRCQVIYKWKGLLEDHMEEIAILTSTELGKNLDESRGEVVKVLEACETAMAAPMLMKGKSLMNVSSGHARSPTASRSASSPASRPSTSRP